MKKLSASLFLLFVFAITSSYQAYSQQTASASSIGLSASLQGSQYEILMPVWTSSTFSIAPAIGILWQEGNATDIRLALVPRFYMYRNKFAPYIGGRLGALYLMPDVGEGILDIVVGPSLGGEYFFDEHFSAGVEAQINLILSGNNSQRFGNPGGVGANTATAVFATVYF